MDDATVEILLRVKKEGEAAFAETNALAVRLKEAIQAITRAQLEGATTGEAYKRVMGQIAAQMILQAATVDEARRQMRELDTALRHYDEAIINGLPAQAAFDAALEMQALDAETAAAAEDQAAAATSAASSGFLAGVPAIALWAGGIAAALLILFPFTTLVLSSVVALTSFAVAGGAMVALLGAMGLGIGGLGALSLFSASQQSNGAFTKAVEPLKQMAATIEQAFAPLGLEILQALGPIIPVIEMFGETVAKWFGQRLPGILSGIQGVFKDLTPDIENFGKFLGQTFDQVSKSGFGTVFEQAIRTIAIPAVEGLITNLVKLSDWFLANQSKLGPIIQDIFGGLGNVIQWVAQHWGQLTDFVENKFPATVKNAQALLQQLQVWWQKNGDTITTFANNLVILMGDFNTIMPVIAKIANALYEFFNVLGGPGPTRMLSELNSIVSALESIYGYVQSLSGGGGPPNALPPNPTGGSRANQFGGGGKAPQITQNNYYTNQTDPTKTALAVTRSLRRVLNPS